MKKTILIGALLLGSLAQADMNSCTSAVKLMGISLDKGVEAYINKDYKGACSYMRIATSFVEKAMINCPAELQSSLQGAYTQSKQTEVTVCNIK